MLKIAFNSGRHFVRRISLLHCANYDVQAYLCFYWISIELLTAYMYPYTEYCKIPTEFMHVQSLYLFQKQKKKEKKKWSEKPYIVYVLGFCRMT